MADSIKPRKKIQKKRRISSVRMLARPDEWAVEMGLKVDGKPFSLEGREFIREVIRDTSPEIVIPKAAQMCFTVTFLTRTAHWISQRKWHHLYLLPIKTGAIPFVQARIDPIIESNEILRTQFGNVDNRLHKQSVEKINWYIRGTNINRELQEIPVDVEVWDERDRMVDENLEDARHRMDGSRIQKLTILSTPTAPGHGVDADTAWWASDQHRWEVPCPHCKRFQVLNFEENIKLGDRADECVCECKFCHKEITDDQRWVLNTSGRWIPENLNGSIRGYHINQLNSPTQRLVKIVEGYYTGQQDAKKYKSFMNNSLGLPYVAAGDQFTEQILDGCVSPSHTLGGIPDGPLFIGVDVGGSLLHMKASTLTRHGQRKLWAMRIFREWGELDDFFSQLTSFIAVIDAHPEKRAARDMSIKYGRKVWLGFSFERLQASEIAEWKKPVHGEACKVTIDKTMALDTVIADYINGRVILPKDARELGENLERRNYNGFYYQMMQMVRIEEENTQEIEIAHWKKNANPDHWHHADMFEFIATLRRPSLAVPAQLATAFQKGDFVASA